MVSRLLAVLILLLGAPVAALAQQAAGAPQVQLRELTVANDTDRVLQQLYIWRTGTPGPGDDRLGANVLPPRASLRVPLGRTANCNWELRAVFDEGEEMRRRVNACRTSSAALAEAGPRREVELANESDLELRELYLFAPGTQDQGRDRLGTATVPVGETFRLRIRSDGTRDCLYDLRAVFADDSDERRQRLDLCRTPRIVFGDPALPTREVPVVNRARRTLRELYASRAASDGPLPPGRAWGQDRLGSAVVAPRESFRMRVRSRDCGFDIRAVYDDDSEEVQRNIDLCVVQGVVFGDRPSADAAPRRVVLLNRHERAIQRVFLSPSESRASETRDWGEEMLGTAMLVPGGRYEAQVVAGCRADLRIVFDSNAAEERRDIDICANPTIALRSGWTVADRLDGDTASLTVAPVQGADTPSITTAPPQIPEAPAGAPALPPVAPMVAPPPVSTAPADPALAAAPAATPPAEPTARVPMAPSAPPAPMAAAPAAAPAAPRVTSGPGVRLRNAALLPVVELYADPPGATTRGPDRLGARVLGVGESMALAAPADLPEAERCRADLTAIFRDGRELRLPDRDLCTAAELVLQ